MQNQVVCIRAVICLVAGRHGTEIEGFVDEQKRVFSSAVESIVCCITSAGFLSADSLDIGTFLMGYGY